MTKPNNPNQPGVQTLEQLTANKTRQTAEADAADAETKKLEAEARRIIAQKALLKAQSSDDALDEQLASATKIANIAAQKKTQSENEAAILKNKLTVPDSGYTGEVKVGDKAGGVEAALLAAQAVNLAAKEIASRLKNHVAGKPIILYAASDLPDFQAWMSFHLQSQAIKNVLNAALARINQRNNEGDALLKPLEEESVRDLINEGAVEGLEGKLAAMSPGGLAPAVVGAGLEAANKILGYFRTDYSVQGVAVTPDDQLFINALAGELAEHLGKISLPSQYNAAALMGAQPILKELENDTQTRADLESKAGQAAATSAKLAAAATKAEDSEAKQKFTQAAAYLQEALGTAKAAMSRFDTFMEKLTTPDDKGKLPLAAILQQAAIGEALRQGAFLMSAKVSSTGGTYYTRKNLWSFFGTMPFFVMGGVVVYFSLFEGQTGQVVSAGAVPVDGGFTKVSKITEKLKPTSQATHGGGGNAIC
jgi:hypothetical protein